MNEKTLTKEEFSEKFMDENPHLCQCHNAFNPPCGFCEGHYVDDEYEEYLEALESESNANDTL